MKFDIDSIVDRPGITRRMMVAVLRGRNRRVSTRERRRRPGPDVPILTLDEIPDFEVVIAITRIGNKFEAKLRWFLLGRDGEFPVIPKAERAHNQVRTSMMPAHQFATEREAVIEASAQAAALTDNFVAWATEGGSDAI